MYENILNQFGAQLKDVVAPAQKFNALVVDSLEKAVKLQLQLVDSYSEIAIEQLRDALNVSDLQSLQAFVGNQQKVAQAVGQKLQQDAKAVAGLGQEFGAEVQKLAQENVQWLNAALQPKARARKAA